MPDARFRKIKKWPNEFASNRANVQANDFKIPIK
jgi:hypothetical protein